MRRPAIVAVAVALTLVACNGSGPAASPPPTSTDDGATYDCTTEALGSQTVQRCRLACASVGDPSTARSTVSVEIGASAVVVTGVAERSPVRIDIANVDAAAHRLMIARGFDRMLPATADGSIDVAALAPLIELASETIPSTATCSIVFDADPGAYSLVAVPVSEAATAEPALATTVFLHG